MTRSTTRRLCAAGALIVLTAAGWANPAFARQSAGPFSGLRIGAGVTLPSGRGPVTGFWTPERGLSAQVATPFRIGYLEAGAAVIPHRTLDPVLPDFLAIQAFVGWGLAWSPIDAVRLSSGLRIGNQLMRFTRSPDPFYTSEMELALGGVARLELMPTRRLGFFGEVSASRTYTYRRYDILALSAGLVLRVRTPDWLRTVLE